MINVDAMRGVVAFLKANPILHYQSAWVTRRCGCLATWTVALRDGVKPGTDLSLDYSDGARILAEAMRSLGLSEAEATALFLQTTRTVFPERSAVRLAEALIARDTGTADEEDVAVLAGYDLPTASGAPVGGGRLGVSPRPQPVTTPGSTVDGAR